MWFKAEPEDHSALASEVSVEDPPARAGDTGFVGEDFQYPADYPYPPSPDPALPLNLVDAESGKELFTCKVCRSSFKQKMQLQAHYKTAHPGYRPYKCDICGNRYFKEGFVRYHRKLHTGEKDYVCDACGRGFVSRARLTAHLKTARFCPASSNVDLAALEKKKNEADEKEAALNRYKEEIKQRINEEERMHYLEWKSVQRERKRAKLRETVDDDEVVVLDD